MSFRNEPILELRRAPARESLLEALRSLDARLPLSVPMRIGTDRSEGDGVLSTDPGNPERVVARAARAGDAEAAAAVAAAQRGFREWSARSAEERAHTLRGAAARL
ncbi:MAG TPA: aldehyde dehydrogenase family protein, partial [Thermoleophilaceae bacterium]|nr:aldehyde dehydrogenase family protein [Thermoleophilaceae bacterium]